MLEERRWQKEAAELSKLLEKQIFLAEKKVKVVEMKLQAQKQGHLQLIIKA